MQDLPGKVNSAMELYLEWGQKALDTWNTVDDGRFYAVMQEREQAYLQFCALDLLAAEAGLRPIPDSRLKSLWTQIDIINRTLIGHMHSAYSEALHRSSLPASFPGKVRAAPSEHKLPQALSSRSHLRLIKFNK